MCGIVGYVGPGETLEFLLAGLRRLEYRGYDSAGVALLSGDGQFHVTRAVGRIETLAEKLEREKLAAVTLAAANGQNSHRGQKNGKANGVLQGVGIGHTRWATHGPATEVNAHPHLGGDAVVAVAHNGVIENYQAIKERLQSDGYVFRSATDTEVIGHLIADCLDKQPAQTSPADKPYRHVVSAVKEALSQLRGAYGLAIAFRDYPGLLIAARLGSPLVVGVGKDEHFIASDASALAGFTDKIVYLADHQIAVMTADSLYVTHRQEGRVRHDVVDLRIDAADVSLNGFPHYMLKEIHEQPEALRNAMRGRLCEEDATAKFGGLNLTPGQLRNVNRIILTACGTSWHAALVAEYMIEELAGIPVEVEYASELRYRNAPVSADTLLFAITQSGETADTLGALREMKRKGHPTLAICNVVGSSIAQEADGGIYLHAGPEIGVASTKAYTSQLMVLAMLGLYFGRLHRLSFDRGRQIIEALRSLPEAIEKALETSAEVRRIAAKYMHANNFLYLGRQYNFPTALEGALKLKEISYIHAEGYPAAEMKHGPIALVDESTPSVFLVPQGFVYDKVLANLEEIKARGGPVIAVVDQGDKRVKMLADDVIYTPTVEEFLQPLVSIIPLQLLAYHMAVLRNCDVDKPRNLAKSVTVE